MWLLNPEAWALGRLSSRPACLMRTPGDSTRSFSGRPTEAGHSITGMDSRPARICCNDDPDNPSVGFAPCCLPLSARGALKFLPSMRRQPRRQRSAAAPRATPASGYAGKQAQSCNLEVILHWKHTSENEKRAGEGPDAFVSLTMAAQITLPRRTRKSTTFF